MTNAARQLLDLLDIEQLEVDLFRGTGPTARAIRFMPISSGPGIRRSR